MKLLGYELKKLFGIRYLWVLLALLIAAALSAYYFLEIGPDSFQSTYYDREAVKRTADFIRRCEEEPEVIAPIREAYDQYRAEADRVSEEIRAGMTEEELIGFRVTEEMLAEHGVTYENRLGYTLPDGTPIHDGDMFAAYDYAVFRRDNIMTHIDDVIEITNGAMRRYEDADATELPVYEYERRYRDIFISLRENISLNLHRQYGWEMMLYFTEFPLFMFAFLILAAGVIYLNERSVGLMPVIRTTRGGRGAIARAKFGALLTVSVFVALLFTVAEVLMTYFAFGLSDVDMAAQEMRWNCPYPITVGGYILALTFLRVLASAAFSCVVAAVASFSFSYAATFIFGAAFLALNVFLSTVPTGTGSAIPNLIDMVNETFLERYSAILIFGHYVNTLAVSVLLFLAVIVFCGVFLAVIGEVRGFTPTPGRVRAMLPAVRACLDGVSRAWDRLRERISGNIRRARNYTSSLFGWEFRKTLSPGIVLLLVLLLASSVYASISVYDEPISTAWKEYEDYVYANHMGELDGERAEKIEALYEEKTRLASDEALDYMMNEYGAGNITWDEYREFLSSQDDIAAEAEKLKTLNEKVSYLRLLKKETGVSGWLLPETAISRVLGRDVNVFLMIAVIVVFSRMYTGDHAKKSSEGEFAAIMRTTKNGRRRMFYARFAAAVVTSLSLAVLFEGADIIIGVLRTEYFADVLAAPISSIERYASLGGMTIGQYLCVTELLRTLSYVPLAMLCCSVSFAAKKLPPTLFIIAALTALPAALIYTGRSAMKYVDLTAALAGGKLLLRSAETSIGGAFTFALALLLGYAALTAAATLFVRHKTGR